MKVKEFIGKDGSAAIESAILIESAFAVTIESCCSFVKAVELLPPHPCKQRIMEDNKEI